MPLLTALRRLSPLYERIFSIREIREQHMVRWYFGASLFFFFLTFYNWIGATRLTVETGESGQSVCWPYFQDCARFFFFHDQSVDYSRSIFYMVLYGVMLLIVWCMWRNKWSLAHALLALLFVWDALVVFLFAYPTAAPYYYYHLFLTAILLFVPHKEFFLKLAFVFFYFMSSTIKFDSTWILGSYFTSLKPGLPLFPDALTPLFTNTIIFSQVVLCWFLLSKRYILQKAAFVFFAFFHLYSGIFVYFFYPSAALLPLLIFFGPLYRYTPPPFSRTALAGWFVIALVALFQVLGFMIPGDRRLTLEGNRFGMFMFEANHQCVITATTFTKGAPATPDMYWEAMPGERCTGLVCRVGVRVSSKKDMTVREERYESGSSLYRCDPYEWWSRYHGTCEQNPAVERISLRFDHSINGGPFYRIIDTDNICALEYKAFTHNEWIKQPPEAPVMGYPVQNAYRD